jgi:hypothetical protein
VPQKNHKRNRLPGCLTGKPVFQKPELWEKSKQKSDFYARDYAFD